MVTREQVAHVARLAKLSLKDQEIDRFAVQLGKILDYVEKLRELDGVETDELTHVAIVDTPLRDDVPRPSLPRAEVLSLAPRADRETILVPPVLEGGEG
ncbi:MAG TPA: Asp-tRNA(Asn)/Glu-tRNA(Gln) amidotransferase subunit GatC [bacterium]|nr:Asp-tRNA(Asn)/Glu-tRNA(Gln) amidotransferase subunit GatC [bacterium]